MIGANIQVVIRVFNPSRPPPLFIALKEIPCSAKKQPPSKSLIAQDTCIEDNLKFTDGLRIDGTVIGIAHLSNTHNCNG